MYTSELFFVVLYSKSDYTCCLQINYIRALGLKDIIHFVISAVLYKIFWTSVEHNDDITSYSFSDHSLFSKNYYIKRTLYNCSMVLMTKFKKAFSIPLSWANLLR